ncbi:MAG: hypothetical protein Q8904_10725 [Bacteroidota bacterium]|nr:hypothetical protein [Bacteroidota bacterium]
MKTKKTILLIGAFIAIIVLSLESFKPANKTPRPAEGIKSYVEFLKTQHSTAEDYIVSLFDKNDVVILCERLHPEFTQYDLILNVCRNPKFIKNVGNVFIEVCTRSQEKNIYQLLHDSETNKLKTEQQILSVCKNSSVHPLWANYNFPYLLNGLYGINKKLDVDKKINLYPSDLPLDWFTMDSTRYSKLEKSFDQRDKIMADYIISKFDSIRSSKGTRKKTLIIMNYRHAFGNNFSYPNNVKPNNVGRFLFDKYNGKISNVLISTYAMTSARSDNDVSMTVIQDGKWDASFKILNIENKGFDFHNSPFGNDYFDIWPFTKHNYKYSDVFNGFVFYKPLDKNKLVEGIPDIIDSSFCKELSRRYQLIKKVTGRDMHVSESIIWSWNKTEEKNPLYTDSIKSKIDNWIK